VALLFWTGDSCVRILLTLLLLATLSCRISFVQASLWETFYDKGTSAARNGQFSEIWGKAAGVLIAEASSAASGVRLARADESVWNSYRLAGISAQIKHNYPEAERLLLAALKEAEHSGENDHCLRASLSDLGEFYAQLGRFAEAEPLYKRALVGYEKIFGPQLHSSCYDILTDLADLYLDQGKYTEAEHLSGAL
jgi:tetratricopeptide (TPR) repeat protein